MNRIQQILSKAERDGTARRVTTEERTTFEPPPAGMGRAVPPPPPLHAHEPVEAPIDAVSYADPPSTVHVSASPRLNPVLIAALQPRSAAAEQFRALRSRIAQAEQGQALRVIQVTSPGKGDGKTVTSLNLALTMAQEFQRRVLVIDADLREPNIHALLGLEPGPGLVDVLTGTAKLDDALVEIPEHHLTVLRAGRAYEHPAEMLGSGPMRRLLDTLRAQFDRIVVDSAPTIVSDPGAVSPLVDGILVVVRAGVTTKPAVAKALGSLGATRLLGLVFNESAATAQGQYGASA